MNAGRAWQFSRLIEGAYSLESDQTVALAIVAGIGGAIAAAQA
ncbi:hypothetical protein EMIT0194MI4_80242 [Pseudomonas sp. IT-194MI4]